MAKETYAALSFLLQALKVFRCMATASLSLINVCAFVIERKAVPDILIILIRSNEGGLGC